MVIEDGKQPPTRMRGVRIDLSNSTAKHRIYLDEDAAEFWPLYNWPWNKYHELNASYCTSAEGTNLILTGRHKPAPYEFPLEKPEHLADLLRTALDQVKAH